MKAFFVLVLSMALAMPGFAGKKAYSNVKFVVLKDNGKPMRNASVIMHPVDKKGHQEKGGLELKTDPEGKTNMDGVPYGKMRIQVIAPGFRTYGEDIEINQPEQEVTIKLEKPQEQYSIYK